MERAGKLRDCTLKKELIINSTTTETRIAIVEDGSLVNLFVEFPDAERNVGDIYKATVRKVLPGMQAAFLDIGWEVDGFIHFSDMYKSAVELAEGTEIEEVSLPEKREGKKRPWKPRADLKSGQEILVQIVKEPLGTKGPRLTSQISLPGRFLVLVPGDNLVGVSKRIPEFKERKRLKTILKRIKPDGFGLICRTIGEGKTEAEVEHDLNTLLRLWRMIESKIDDAPSPSRLHKEAPLTSSIIRDLFGPDVDRVIIDDKRLYREIRAYVRAVAMPLLERVQFHAGPSPVFDLYNIEQEIEKGLSRKVWFGGGSYLIIEQTEAVVTIDVNSGRFVGKEEQEENNLRVNLKACREIARQIRLRDLGGIIIIDLIDMYNESNRKKVFDAMQQAMSSDRAKWDIAPISQFGIMEMTRQRTKSSLVQAFNEPCPTCNGSGLIESKETVVTRLQSWVRRFRAMSGEMGVTIKAHPVIVEYITQGLRSHLRRIMWDALLYIKLEPDATLKIDEFKAYSWKQKRDVTIDFQARPAEKSAS